MLALIGFLLILFLGFSLVMIFLGLLRQFFARFAVLEETKVGESFRQGWRTVQASVEECRFIVAGDAGYRNRIFHCQHDPVLRS